MLEVLSKYYDPYTHLIRSSKNNINKIRVLD